MLRLPTALSIYKVGLDRAQLALCLHLPRYAQMPCIYLHQIAGAELRYTMVETRKIGVEAHQWCNSRYRIGFETIFSADLLTACVPGESLLPITGHYG